MSPMLSFDLEKLLRNSYYSGELSENIINNSIRFANKLPERLQEILQSEDITITPYGTVIFYFEREIQKFVEIEVGETKIGFFSTFSDNQLHFLYFTSNVLEIFPLELNEALNKLNK